MNRENLSSIDHVDDEELLSGEGVAETVISKLKKNPTAENAEDKEEGGSVPEKPLLLDGISLRDKILEEIRELVASSKKVKKEGPPGLATIVVGDDPASHTYVAAKRKTAKSLGFNDFHHHLDKTISEDKLIDFIKELGKDEKVHGILVQLPLPSHISADIVSLCTPWHKDVDGFHPINLGRLQQGFYTHSIAACTPSGIMYMLRDYGIKTAGMHAVVVGRSDIVGKPMATMLAGKSGGNLIGGDATVTIAHSKTKNLKEITLQADLLVVAMGKPRAITADMVKQGAVVVDVGINRIQEGGKMKLVGDVDFENVKKKASAITPVPGGVGPMTIAMLMTNTWLCYEVGHRPSHLLLKIGQLYAPKINPSDENAGKK